MGFMNFAVVDLETTGLDALRDRIVEVAILQVDEFGSVTREYDTLVNPGRTPGPSAVHGIFASQLERAPRFHQIAGDLCDLLRDRLFVAYQAIFDAGFLVQEFHRARLGAPVFARVCLREEAKRIWGGAVGDLKSVCRLAGVTTKPRHEALSDARAAAALLQTCLEIDPQFKVRAHAALRPSLWPPAPGSGLRLSRGALL